jgi:hypothetical protein
MRKNTVKVATRICDSELDMRRLLIRAPGRPVFMGTLGRFLTAILSAGGATSFGSARRSIDREQQQYSPPSD